MRFRFLHILTLAVLLPAVSVFSAEATGKGKTADDAWQNISAPVSAGAASRSPSVGTVKNATQVKADDQQKVVQLKQAAQAAKDFQASYPADPRARDAKKLEAVYLVQAARPSDADRGQAALAVAAAYRNDKSNSAQDRFDVAVLMERQQYAVLGEGKILAKDAVTHEKTADKLRAEFGDTPEVYAFYLGVVNTADPENAHRVAQRIQTMPAPAYAKSEAQVTIDRHALIGKALTTKFTDADGKPVVLSQAGSPTIVYVWSPTSTPNAFKALANQKGIPSDARWIYIALNTTSGGLDLVRKQAPFPGVHCLELPVAMGPLTNALKIRHLPYVYVFGRDGAMVGYGQLEDLPGLLRAANH